VQQIPDAAYLASVAATRATLVHPLQVPLWIDLTAVVVGALAGASIAARERLDVIGALLLAVVMGLGGGIVRDLLLGVRPGRCHQPLLPADGCRRGTRRVRLHQSGPTIRRDVRCPRCLVGRPLRNRRCGKSPALRPALCLGDLCRRVSRRRWRLARRSDRRTPYRRDRPRALERYSGPGGLQRLCHEYSSRRPVASQPANVSTTCPASGAGRVVVTNPCRPG